MVIIESQLLDNFGKNTRLTEEEFEALKTAENVARVSGNRL
jgi:hypothetical protein